ncbi:MAG: DNA polymerase III subunit delta' [Nitrospirae bacterium]|nr:DNA polymerase III subunit delta' [Nitrospirota bacterium]
MTGAPSGFSTVVGHADTIARLRASYARDRLAAAYLLHGDDGIGKRTVAEAWIRLIQCLTPTGPPAEAEACGACASCRHHAANTHPDFLVLEPQEATVITVDQIRDAQAVLPYRPLLASRRVVLVPDASRLNLEAANALLKLLEEPPPHVVCVLIAAQRERLLPTLVSRCQAVRCAPPSEGAVIDHLIRRLGLAPDRARALFIRAQGHIGPAIEAAQIDDDDPLSLDDVGAPSTIAKTVALLDLAARIGKDQQALKTLVAWLSLWLRDVLAWKITRDPGRVLHADRQSDLTWWADRLSIDDVSDLASGLHAVWASRHRNLNPQLVAEVALLHISCRVTHPRRQETA